MRRLKGRPPASDLFGIKGRAWLAEQTLRVEERETIDAGLRQIGFLDAEIAEVQRLIALDALQITAGAPRYPGKTGIWATNKATAQAERALAQQAELAYKNKHCARRGRDCPSENGRERDTGARIK